MSDFDVQARGIKTLSGLTDFGKIPIFGLMAPITKIFQKHRHIWLYAFCSAILIFLLKWLEWKFLIADNSIDIYVGLIAVFFTAFGIWIASQVSRRKVRTLVVEKEILVQAAEKVELNHAELALLNLTSREQEVLELMCTGKSNAEIATALFLSVSTIKTHASNLFFKLDVKTRTQAIEKAKRLRLVA